MTPPELPTPPLRCVVTDDDPTSRRVLEGHIAQTPQLQLVATFPDGLQLLTYLQSQPAIDILFLDVQMPGLSGLDVLNTLRLPAHAPAVVLTTSHADFAVEAFALRVVDYLVKPIEYPRFIQALTRVREWLQRGEVTPPAPVAAGGTGAAPANRLEDSLFLKVGDRLVRIPYVDILYVEAVGQYAVVVTPHHQYSTSFVLGRLAERLPPVHFERVHRSYVVNCHHIEEVRDATVMLKGGRAIPIGRTYLKDFLARLSE